MGTAFSCSSSSQFTIFTIDITQAEGNAPYFAAVFVVVIYLSRMLALLEMEIGDSQLESGCKMEKIKNWTESDTNEGFLSKAPSEPIRGGISKNNEIAGVIVVVCGG